jgi:hypothetical protein
MTFRGDERAVSTVVGAVLVFGILVLALGVYQAQIVPAENEAVEYRHSQTVQQDLQELRNSLVGAASTGASAPVTIELGTRYPLRTFAVNPPPVYGTVESVPLSQASKVTLSNVRATDEEADDYLSGTLAFETKGLAYEGSYNQYRSGPGAVRYEHGALYNDYAAGDINLTAGLVVDGADITVLTLNASDGFSESGIEPASVDPKALSAPYRATEVENSGGTLTLTLPTNASRQYWDETYEGRPNVADVSLAETPSGNVTTIEFVDGTYDLRMAAVGVGDELERPEPKYLTVVGGDGTDSVTVEVRDQYNNPERWTVNATNPSLFKQGSVKTGSDGQAVFAVKSGVADTDTTLQILGNNSAKEYVSVNVSSTPGNNPTTPVAGPYEVAWNTSGMGNRENVEYSGDTLTFDWTTPEAVTLLSNVTDGGEGLSGVDLDYASADPSAADIAEGNDTTNATGQAATDATLSATETKTKLYVTADGDSDTVKIKREQFRRDDIAPGVSLPSGVNYSYWEAPINSPSEMPPVYGTTPTDTGNRSTFDIEPNRGDDFAYEFRTYVKVPQNGSYDFRLRSDDGSRLYVGDTLVVDNGGNHGPQNATASAGLEAGYHNVTVRYYEDSGGQELSVWWRGPGIGGQFVQVPADRLYRGQGAQPRSGPLTSVRATSVLPNVNGQRQTLSFTVGSELPSGEYVAINLSEAQSTSPEQVSYGGATLVSGGGGINNFGVNNNGNDAVVNYSSGGLNAGDQVVIRMTGVNTGPPANQSNPYSVPFERTDGGSATDSFSAAYDDGNPELSGVSASDMRPGTGRTQTVSFSLDTDLENGEQVDIGLSDAQGAGGSSVNYGNANGASVTSGSGSASLNVNGDRARITYTSNGDTAGDTVAIEMSGQNAQLSGGSATFTVGFSREDADTASTTFEVSNTPTLNSKVVDQSQRPSNGPTRYEVSYDIGNRDNFERVRISFNSSSAGFTNRTYTSTDPRNNVDNFGWDSTFYTSGTAYDITIEVIDTNGNVVDTRTVTDVADGVDPSGNADLTESDSPALSGVRATDTTDNQGAGYDVSYTVDDPAGKFVETEVLFYNRDASYATEQGSDTTTPATVSYSTGGAGGNQYYLIVQVQDDDGIVVAQRNISDVAGQGSGIDEAGFENNPSAVAVNTYQNFQADALNDQFTVDQVQIQDRDGDSDLTSVKYVVTNNNGDVVATRTDGASGQQYQVQNFVVNDSVAVADGETYTMTVTGYDADANSASDTRSDTTPTYDVTINSASNSRGNDISVEFDVTTTDSNAEVEVISLNGGTERDSSGQIQVASNQPQTETIGGGNQATDVRVILYDGNGNERERVTVAFPYP